MTRGVNTRLENILTALTDPSSPLLVKLDQVVSNLLDISLALGGLNTVVSDIDTNLLTLLDRFGENAIGPGGTLLALLTAIDGNTNTACNARVPDPLDLMGCEAPFTSEGQRTVSDYDNRTFAFWNTSSLPAGVTEGTFLDPAIEGAELVHEETDGWKLYVLSCASHVFSYNPTSEVLFPTNQWIDVSGMPALALSVPAGADIQAYLCQHVDAPFTECVELDSQATTYETSSEFSLPCAAIFFDGISGLTCTDQMESTGLTEGYTDPCGVLTGDLGGFIVRRIGTGPTIRLEWTVGAARDGRNIDPSDTTDATIPAGVDHLIILNVGATSSATDSFTIQLCPPAP